MPSNSTVRHKRGDVHPVTGLVYWDTLHGKERWRSAQMVRKWRKRLLAYVVAWQKSDLPRLRAAQKRLRDKHGVARNARSRGYRNAWKKRRKASDPLYKLGVNCSSCLRVALKRAGYAKSKRVSSLFGCTLAQLRDHLESNFKAGMSWNNYGYHGWHVDHKIPISSANSRREIYRLFHYKNLQPLWQKDNFSKGSKIL